MVMTTDEMNRKEGDMLVREKQLKRELELRREDARKIAARIQPLASLLQKAPEGAFLGNGSEGYDISPVQDFNEHDLREALDFEKIVEVTNEIRRLTHELKLVQTSLQAFG